MIIHYQTGTTRHKKQLQLVLWLLNGNWTGAIDYVFWNAASKKNNNNISQFLFFFFNSSLLLHPQDPNWKLRLISLSQPLHPLATFSADTCVHLAAAQSFKMSLSVKTCLILFLITASYCMASVPTPNLDLPIPLDSVFFGSCILTSKLNYIGALI